MVPGPILVTGATGRQGGSVTRHLIARGAELRALTRDPESTRARELAARGIRTMKGDMDDADSLREAMAGARVKRDKIGRALTQT